MPAITVAFDEVSKTAGKEGSIVMWGHAEWADIFAPEQVRTIDFCEAANPAPAVAIGSSAVQGSTSAPTTTEGVFVFRPTPFKPDCNASR
jgi:hypothetical protein